MSFENRQGCIHSPPLIRSMNENKDTDDECDNNHLFMDISIEEQRVNEIFRLTQINPTLHFYTYLNKELQEGGRSIYNFSSGKYISLSKHLHTHRSPKEFIHLFIYSFVHLCDSVHLMKTGINDPTKMVIHGHLNILENVLIRVPEDNPLISDFSISLEKLLNQPYNPSNVFLPLELHFFQFLCTNNLQSVSEQNINDLVYDIYANSKLAHFIPPNEAIQAFEYLSPYINSSKSFIKEKVCESAHTWDMYALCANYLLILHDFKSYEFEKHIQLCKRLFIGNMNLNPKYRREPNPTKELIKKIFSSQRRV